MNLNGNQLDINRVVEHPSSKIHAGATFNGECLLGMRGLAVDTTGHTCAVALVQGSEVIIDRVINEGKTHAQTLAPTIQTVLNEAGWSADALDWFACTIGPGSFTGIRIGLATIQGMALGCGRSVIPVNALDALAEPYLVNKPESVVTLDADDYAVKLLVLSVMDARGGRAYAQMRSADQIIIQPQATTYEAVAQTIEKILRENEFPFKLQIVGVGASKMLATLQKLLANGLDQTNDGLSHVVANRSVDRSFALIEVDESGVIMGQSVVDAAIRSWRLGWVMPVLPGELNALYLSRSQAERMNGIEVNYGR